MLRRRGGQPTDDLAQGQHVARPFLQERLEPEAAQKARLVAAAARIVVPAHGGVADAGHHAASQMIIDVVLKLADMDGAVEQRALMPMEPQRLRYHPFRRNRSGARAVDLQCWIAGGRHLCRHVARAQIHPDERGTQWLPRSIQRHHAAAGGINREGRHLIGPDLRFLHGLAHRPAERTPPIIGILLRPARLWENRRVGGRTKAARLTLQVEHSGAQRLRAAIYTNDVAFGHVLNPVPAGRPSRNPSCKSESRTRTGRTEPVWTTAIYAGDFKSRAAVFAEDSIGGILCSALGAVHIGTQVCGVRSLTVCRYLRPEI